MRGMAGTVTPSVDAEGGRVEQPRSQLDGHFPPVPPSSQISPHHRPGCLSALAPRLGQEHPCPPGHSQDPAMSLILMSSALNSCTGGRFLRTRLSLLRTCGVRLLLPTVLSPALSHLEVEWPSPWPAILTSQISPNLPPLSAKVTFRVCKYD